jgi:transcriptional regulator with XRE-family HTH domain
MGIQRGENNMNRKSIHIGENLAYLRKTGRFSIEEVAEKIGVSRQAVSKWEAGVSHS